MSFAMFSSIPQTSSRNAGLLMVLIAIGVASLVQQIVAPSLVGTWLFLLLGSVTGLAFFWRNLEWGMIVYLCAAWMVIGTPEIAYGGSGEGQRLYISELGLAALLVLGIGRGLVGSRRSLISSPVNVPIIAYLVFATVATFSSLLFPDRQVLAHSPRTYLQVNLLELGIRYLALGGVLVAGHFLSGRYLRYAAVALLLPGLGTFLGVLSFIPQTSYQAFPQTLAMSVLAAFALVDKGKPWHRYLAGGVALAIFGVYFIKDAEWVSGWLGGIVALALITWSANRKLFFLATLCVSVIVIARFPYFYEKVYTSNFYAHRIKIGKRAQDEQGDFTNDRSRMLYAATKYAARFPLGIGLGNYRAYNTWYGKPENWNTTTFTSAHGTYAQVLSETGWGGFGLFLWLLYANGSLLNRTYKALPEGRWKTYTLGAWGGCIGLYCSAFNGDYFFPVYHNGGLATFGACVYIHLVVGIVLAVAREKKIGFGRNEPAQAAPTQHDRDDKTK